MMDFRLDTHLNPKFSLKDTQYWNQFNQHKNTRINQGIPDYTATETIAKLFRALMKRPGLWRLKESLAFFRMHENFKWLCFGCFVAGSLVEGAFHSCIITYITELLTCAYSRLETGSSCYCSLWKRCHCVWFSLLFIILFSCMFRNWSFKPGPKTYTFIPFKIGVDNF